MKVTEEELNLAYLKANSLKIDGSPIKDLVDIDVERNPLVDSEFFDSESEFVTPFKLSFRFDTSVGPKGSYVLATEVEVIESDEE